MKPSHSSLENYTKIEKIWRLKLHKKNIEIEAPIKHESLSRNSPLIYFHNLSITHPVISVLLLVY